MNSPNLVCVLFAPILMTVMMSFLKDAIIVEMRPTNIVMQQVSMKDYRMISRFICIIWNTTWLFFVNIHPCVITYRAKIAAALSRSVTTFLLIMNKEKNVYFQNKAIIQEQDERNIAIMKKSIYSHSNYYHIK